METSSAQQASLSLAAVATDSSTVPSSGCDGQYSTAQHSAAQHSTAQHTGRSCQTHWKWIYSLAVVATDSTVQHSTSQRSTRVPFHKVSQLQLIQLRSQTISLTHVACSPLLQSGRVRRDVSCETPARCASTVRGRLIEVAHATLSRRLLPRGCR